MEFEDILPSKPCRNTRRAGHWLGDDIVSRTIIEIVVRMADPGSSKVALSLLRSSMISGIVVVALADEKPNGRIHAEGTVEATCFVMSPYAIGQSLR